MCSTNHASPKKGWRLELHQLFQTRDTRFETVHFKIHDPQGDNVETVASNWFQDDPDRPGKEYYITPQVKLIAMDIKKKHFAQIQLHIVFSLN